MTPAAVPDTPRPFSLPDLESLACADALARTLHFQRAAHSRGLSPAAFGRRIAALEAQLGRTLFVRTTRRVLLAPGAEDVLAAARRVLEDAASLGAATARVRVRDVVLATRHELGMSWLMPARAALHARVPGLRVHMVFGATHEIEGAVHALRAHAAVTSRAPASTAFDAEPLHREDYVLVASPRVVARARVRDVDDLQHHALLDLDPSLPLAGYLLRAAGAVRFASVLGLGTIDAVRYAARAGEGVAVLPRYFVADDVRRRRLVALLPRVPLAHDFFRLVFRRDAPERALLLMLAGVLRELPLR